MLDDSTRRRFVASVASVRAATLSGCLGGRPGDAGSSGTSGEIGETAGTTAETTATATDAGQTVGADAREHLDDRLVGLVETDDRAAYARRRKLSVDEGRVLVAVELRPGADPPSTPSVAVDRRHGSLVEGRVDVDALPALATADAVAYVRPPRKPVADAATASFSGGT